MGGGERHLSDLVNALAQRGHDVHVALRPRSPLQAELKSLPAENIFPTALRNALDLKSALELASYIRERQIEIVHAHVARDYPLAALATKRKSPAKLIITRHVLFPLNKLHSVTLSHVGRVIAVSRAVERTLLSQNIFPASKIRVIQNGIDFRRLDARLGQTGRDEFCRRMEIAPESLLVGTVGDLKPQKGHEDFLRAASIIARAEPRAHFIIVGEDTTRAAGGQYRAMLEGLINSLGLMKHVHLTGWLDDTAPLLSALDVYVSASRTESFGLAIVEAMASGAGVVATMTEGACEIIDDEETGLLTPIGDAEALARAIEKLLEDASLRTSIGALARTRARTRFSLERMVDETEQVYLESN
jgi:glycosyltransferase involved in cell wall biosynthesis